MRAYGIKESFWYVSKIMQAIENDEKIVIESETRNAALDTVYSFEDLQKFLFCREYF